MVVVKVAGTYLVPPGRTFVFGRGSADSPVDLVISAHSSVSRVAGWLDHGADGVVRIVNAQRRASGSVSIERPDGVRIAIVGPGPEHAVPVAEADFVIVVRADVVVRVPVEVRSDAIVAPAMASAGATQAVWTPRRVLHPTPAEQWRLVAAVAAVHATVRGRPGRPAIPKASWMLDRLERCRQAGLLPPSVTINQSWLSRQLEKAMSGLDLEPMGDKLPAIVDAVHGHALLGANIVDPLRDLLFGGAT